MYVAKSNDLSIYVVLMHFNESLRLKIRDKEVLTEDFIDAAIQEIQLENLKNKGGTGFLKSPAALNNLRNLKATQSIIQRDNKLEIFNYDSKDKTAKKDKMANMASTKSLIP